VAAMIAKRKKNPPVVVSRRRPPPPRWATDRFVSSKLYASQLSKYKSKSVAEMAAGILQIPRDLRQDLKDKHCTIVETCAPLSESVAAGSSQQQKEKAARADDDGDEGIALRVVLEDSNCQVFDDAAETWRDPELSAVFVHRGVGEMAEHADMPSFTDLISREQYVAFFPFGKKEQMEVLFPGG
jgi:hypothetical protein